MQEFKKELIGNGSQIPTGSITVQLFLCFVLSSILFFGTVKGLINDWLDRGDASHGLLIPFIVLWLIYRKKNEIIPLISGKRAPIALYFMVFSLVLFSIGKLSLVLTIERAFFVVFIISTIVYLVGKNAARKIKFPLFYIFFMLPLPLTLIDFLTFPMKKIATTLSVSFLSFLSIPVYKEGNVIFLPATTLEVVNACSGLNSVISLVALGILWGYVSFEKNYKRFCLLSLLIPIAIIANAARIIVTALISNFSSLDITQGLMHDFSGTLVVLVTGFLLIIISSGIIKRV